MLVATPSTPCRPSLPPSCRKIPGDSVFGLLGVCCAAKLLLAVIIAYGGT